MKRIIKWGSLVIGIIIGGLIFFAIARTWGKTEIEFLIHINQELVQQSAFGESPTFAIWLEDPESGLTFTTYVTRRAGVGDWEGKSEVPVALPLWFEINKAEKQRKSQDAKTVVDEVFFTGATPKPGYFRTRVRVKPGSKWICWIETNLAGDYNKTFPEYTENHIQDEFATGQPALLYKAEIEVLEEMMAVPEIAGMCVFDRENQVKVVPMFGITTANEVFDEISITVVRPKPRIIQKPINRIP